DRSGVRHGDRVALIARNSDLALILFVALAKRGAIFVPVNPALTDADLTYIVRHSRARIVVAESAQAERADAIADHAAVIDMTTLGAAESDAAGVLRVLETRGVVAPPVHVDANDGALVIYTSGTTGLPKGVLHSHRNYVLAGEAFVERMRLQP